MNANELRLGNWVSVGGNTLNTYQTYRPLKLTISILSDIQRENNERPDAVLSVYQPIRLSEEWLLAYGFKMVDGFLELNTSHNLTLIQGDKNGFFEVFELNHDTLRIKYVHQLQNLYFVLTGEEL
jgi:hypothetical protein